jgi:Divergent InlB B-repeat domain
VVALTVAVSGGGRVTSTPGGISCKPVCKTHLRKGAKVTLKAIPRPGREFSHWSAPCRTSKTCTVTMSRARIVRAYFKPVPTPPPTREAGHYSGTYTDGTFFSFDLSGTTITNVSFDFNGVCSDGGTSSDTGVTVTGPFAVAADGSFSGNGSITFSSSTVTETLSGTVTTTGTASGSLRVGIEFSNGTTCTSSGTWTAEHQS